MQLAQNPIIYTIFDGDLLYPHTVNFGAETYCTNPLQNNLKEEGLILPFVKAIPGNGITLEYLGSNDYKYNTGKLFLVLRNDGIFEEYFKNTDTGALEAGKISPTISRYVANDEGHQRIASHIALMAKDIHEYANLLEMRLGIDTSTWSIYSIKELQQYVLGNLSFEKLKVKTIKRQYKTIWLK